MDRREKLLEGLNPTLNKGLEIGALHAPILRRPQDNVMYLDHADTLTLRRSYAQDTHVPAGDIVDLDIVWEGQSLKSLVGPTRCDHVVASHVVEHVPDVVWWLSELAGVLASFGVIRLAIPDKRFCFDFARQETTKLALGGMDSDPALRRRHRRRSSRPAPTRFPKAGMQV